MGILGHPCPHCGEKLHDDEECYCRSPHVRVVHEQSHYTMSPTRSEERIIALLEEMLSELKSISRGR